MEAKLYYHRTDGGAEYLTDRYIECAGGHREGIFEGATIVVRLDGQPEITVRQDSAELAQSDEDMHAALRCLTETATTVANAWAGGDLASAVRALVVSTDAARATLNKADGRNG